MHKPKQKFFKFCTRCGERFKPDGTSVQKLCNECYYKIKKRPKKIVPKE